MRIFQIALVCVSAVVLIGCASGAEGDGSEVSSLLATPEGQIGSQETVAPTATPLPEPSPTLEPSPTAEPTATSEPTSTPVVDLPMNDDCLDCIVVMPNEGGLSYKKAAALKELSSLLLVTCGAGYRVGRLGLVAGPYEDTHGNEILVKTERLIAPRGCYVVTAKYFGKPTVYRESGFQFVEGTEERVHGFRQEGLMEKISAAEYEAFRSVAYDIGN